MPPLNLELALPKKQLFVTRKDVDKTVACIWNAMRYLENSTMNWYLKIVWNSIDD